MKVFSKGARPTDFGRSVKVHIFYIWRPQNCAKSSPYFCPMLCQSKVRWRFRKILWPSQKSEYMNFTLTLYYFNHGADYARHYLPPTRFSDLPTVLCHTGAIGFIKPYYSVLSKNLTLKNWIMLIKEISRNWSGWI